MMIKATVKMNEQPQKDANKSESQNMDLNVQITADQESLRDLGGAHFESFHKSPETNPNSAQVNPLFCNTFRSDDTSTQNHPQSQTIDDKPVLVDSTLKLSFANESFKQSNVGGFGSDMLEKSKMEEHLLNSKVFAGDSLQMSNILHER